MLPWLLLPGTLCTDAVFAPVLAEPALVGIARGARPVAGFGAPDAAGAAARLLAGMRGDFALIAFSLGGFVALEMALAAGPRLRRMVLIGVTGRADLPVNRPVREALLHDSAAAGQGALVRERLWPGYVAAGNRDDTALREAVSRMADDTTAEEFSAQTAIALTRRDLRAAAAGIACPVLILHGAEDAATPPDRGEELAAALPQARRAVIAGAGHFVLMERPAAVAAEIAGWLADTGG